ncbi:MAG: PepSY-associated TM helix domain-containing protein [Pseudomonadota bacterium]
MIGSFRQSMTWLHTWAGLVFCWLLYFVFVTGTLGYFDTEIDHWMKPELASLDKAPIDTRIDTAMSHLEANAQGANRWFISFGETREEPYLRVFWQTPGETEDDPPENTNVTLDALSGEPLDDVARDTGGGQLLYRMHYVLHYIDSQIAFRFVGILTLFMFVGMITGIIAHKKIFKDFFTFRVKKGQRSWLDMHNLLSVTSLPFQLMIIYSGLLFVTILWMPLIAVGSVGFDTKKAGELLDLGGEKIEAAGTPAELTDVRAVLAHAEATWGEGSVERLNIYNPGDANARIEVSPATGIGLLPETHVYDGTTGELIDSPTLPSSGALSFASTMLGLHEGLFAGITLRWLYFLSGVLGTAMIATGAILWTSKRRKKAADEQQSRGFHFVEIMNIGTIMGVLIGVAAFFWANRLLPVSLESRADWEAHAMFIAWGLCLIYPLFRSRRAAWRDLTWLTAFAFAALPILNAATTNAGLLTSIGKGDWTMAGFDLTALGTGVVFAIAGLYLTKRGVTREVPSEQAAMEVAAS